MSWNPLSAGEDAYAYPDGQEQRIKPIIPDEAQSGEDTDTSTPLDFDLTVDSYAEYWASVNITTPSGGGTSQELKLGINGITDGNYYQNEAQTGSLSQYNGSNWRFGYFDADGRAYRATFRISVGDSSVSGPNYVGFAPFTVFESRQPSPLHGYYDSAGGTSITDMSSINIATTGDAAGQVTIKGVSRLQEGP